ncbi:response regulator [Gracilibacillus massiliensis]|uniref:response regulator n=1 Tax=Gracilibacillus massiliensis TaxID=1564956 RepID=UPI00071E2D07|nr:response regulator [Gracilibacillus massiliensis]
MHKINILIVDDEPRLRRGIERQVLQANEDFEVIGSFSDGIECLNAIETKDTSFDLLITDVKMPEMDGLTLIKKLKQKHSFLSVVISGFDDFKFLQTAIREGASDYLIKPIDRSEFRSQLLMFRDKIMKKRMENKKLREITKDAEQSNYLKQIQLLQEITNDQKQDISQIDWTKEFPKGYYLSFYVCIDQRGNKRKKYSDQEWDNWIFAIGNIMDEMLQERKNRHLGFGWKWIENKSSWWVMLHSNQLIDFDSQAQTFATRLLSNIRQFTMFSCTLAMSDPFDQLPLLQSLKVQLKTAIKFRIFDGGNQIITANNVATITNHKTFVQDPQIVHQIDQIVLALHHTERDQVQKHLTIYLKTISAYKHPMDIEKALHLLAVKVWSELNSYTIGLSSEAFQDVFSVMENITSLPELKIEVWNWMDRLMEISELSKISDHENQVEKAKKWVIKNLDQQITIDRIADHVYMNPTYFCQQFKSDTGETVHEFVTRQRMKEARRLLKEEHFKISEITEKVGYHDTKYFSKLFKQYYGETPSRYKVTLNMKV